MLMYLCPISIERRALFRYCDHRPAFSELLNQASAQSLLTNFLKPTMTCTNR